MTTAGSLLPEAPPEAGAVYAATVSRPDPVMVTLDSYGPEHEWGPVTWVGAGTPVRGDRCLALIDDKGHLWGAPVAAPPARARVERATPLSLTDNLVTTLTWDLEVFDTAGSFSIAADDRLIAVQAGCYLIGAAVQFDVNATGRRSISINRSDGAQIARQSVPAITGASSRLAISTLYELAAGEHVRVEALQNSGGALSIASGNLPANNFWMTRTP